MSAPTQTLAAADLGASSGRVMAGRVGPDTLDLTEVHRFPNRPVHLPEGLRRDILGLYRGVLDGLRAAGPVDSLGIDSWAVDHGLLDAEGALPPGREPYAVPAVRHRRHGVRAFLSRCSSAAAERLGRVGRLPHLALRQVAHLPDQRRHIGHLSARGRRSAPKGAVQADPSGEVTPELLARRMPGRKPRSPPAGPPSPLAP